MSSRLEQLHCDFYFLGKKFSIYCTLIDWFRGKQLILFPENLDISRGEVAREGLPHKIYGMIV